MADPENMADSEIMLDLENMFDSENTTDSATSDPNLPEVELVIPPLGMNRTENLFRMIIFALYYFGCDIGDIFRVLSSYGYPHNPETVSDYITRENLIDHYARGHRCPEEGEVMYRARTDGVNVRVTIDYNATFPEIIRVRSRQLPFYARPADEVIASDPEMCNIATRVIRNGLWCYMNEANLHMLDDLLYQTSQGDKE